MPARKTFAAPVHVKLLGNVYMCAVVSVPAAHEYWRCAAPYIRVTVPVCTASYRTLSVYVTVSPDTLAMGDTAVCPVATMLTDAVIPVGRLAEKFEVRASDWFRLTTLTPRVVELIVGNVYTSDPATANVYRLPYVVENSNDTPCASCAVAVYAILTARAVTTALVSGICVVPLSLRESSSDALVCGKSAPSPL